jgi:hypothetical protein
LKTIVRRNVIPRLACKPSFIILIIQFIFIHSIYAQISPEVDKEDSRSIELENALHSADQSLQQSIHSQKKVSSLSDEAQLKLDKYLANQHQADVTEAYNKQMVILIGSQQRELQDIQVQIDSIEETERAMLPMLNTMVSNLSDFVAQDIPFLVHERQRRISKLEAILTRADVSVAEKYRQILEAYMVEVGYGRTIEAYSGAINMGKGLVKNRSGVEQHHVNFLRMGRVGLYYQSLNGLESALWLPLEQRWRTLGDTQNQVIAKAMQVARQQKVPELLALPLPPLSNSKGH